MDWCLSRISTRVTEILLPSLTWKHANYVKGPVSVYRRNEGHGGASRVCPQKLQVTTNLTLTFLFFVPVWIRTRKGQVSTCCQEVPQSYPAILHNGVLSSEFCCEPSSHRPLLTLSCLGEESRNDTKAPVRNSDQGMTTITT